MGIDCRVSHHDGGHLCSGKPVEAATVEFQGNGIVIQPTQITNDALAAAKITGSIMSPQTAPVLDFTQLPTIPVFGQNPTGSFRIFFGLHFNSNLTVDATGQVIGRCTTNPCSATVAQFLTEVPPPFDPGPSLSQPRPHQYRQ